MNSKSKTKTKTKGNPSFFLTVITSPPLGPGHPHLFATIALFLFSSSSKKTTSPFISSFSHNLRRPIRITTQPVKMSDKTPTLKLFLNPHDFQSPQTLSDWLRPRLPQDFLTWGVKPGTKNVDNLWLELFEGEMLLEASTPPKRTVNVATVKIKNQRGDLLLESHQELSDGSIRERSRPLSEKMKPGENINEAALRAIREELGSLLVGYGEDGVRILLDTYERQVEERASVSYPGLPACYVLHSVEASVDCLPDGEFCTEEQENEHSSAAGSAGNAIFVKRHFWKWVPQESEE